MTTSIEWTDKTWNPIRGCTRVSAGCVHCYAERQAARFAGPGQPYEGLVRISEKADGRREPRWTGAIRFVPEKLAEPLSWRKPARVFVNSMSDLFHEGVSDEQIAAIFGVMAACPQHTFQVLTKRPERMREWFEWIRCSPVSLGGPTVNAGRGAKWWAREYVDAIDVCARPWVWPLPNVWLGVSVEDQRTADERIPLLLDTPAAVWWVSYEPALGPVDFREHLSGDSVGHETGGPQGWVSGPGLDWIVIGGESGPGARPFDLAWARSTIEQARAAGVPVFVKQLGARPMERVDERHAMPPVTHKTVTLRDRKGGDPSEWPEDLRVREWREVSR